MAETSAEKGDERQQERPYQAEEGLKYLGFVQVVAVHARMCLAKLYELAKENSGPLRPRVQSVEGTVKAVVGPVCEKFHGVPYELLKFFDRKVGTSVHELKHHVPALVRQASSQAYAAAQKAPEVARSVATEVQRAGVVETATEVAKAAVAKCEPTAKEIYAKYEPVAEHYAVSGWRALNRLPVFPHVAQIVVPTAAYWSAKYNGAVCLGREHGYTIATYLPEVPTEKIAKVFESPDARKPSAGEGVAAAQ